MSLRPTATEGVTRRALVTGASRGIGAAVAVALARDGHDVIINYVRDEASAKSVAEKVRALGRVATVARFDVAERAETRDAIAALLAEGPIDVVVNNAGVIADAPFPSCKPDDWERVTRTSLDGFYNVTQPLVMPMVRRRFGRVITVSSISGVHGNRGQVNYSAAKAGLIGATKALAQELAKHHVTANAVAPGLIETDMVKDSAIDEILKHIPMRRMGKAEEVADLVSYLASDKTSYLTGQVIAIAGGL